MVSMHAQTWAVVGRWHLEDARPSFARSCTTAPARKVFETSPDTVSDDQALIKAQTLLASTSYQFKHEYNSMLQLKELNETSFHQYLWQQQSTQPAVTIAAAAQQFCIDVGEAFMLVFIGMVAPDGVHVYSSQPLLRIIATLLDQILVLDALKAFKASVIDDLVMLQHAQQRLLSSGLLSSDAEDTSLNDLVEFLSDRWWCVKVLYGSVKQVNYHHRVMGRIVQFLSDSLADKDDATATAVGAESHSQLRALALALYLLFPSEEGKLGVEAIGSKQLHRGIKLLKQKPVVPGFGDMPLSLLFILHELSPFLVAQGQENKDAGLALSDKQTAKLYNVQKQVAGVRNSHDAFTDAFAAYAVQMDDFRLSTHQPSPQLLQQGMLLASEGLRLLGTWSALVSETHSWKLSQYQAHPVRRVSARNVPSMGKYSPLQQRRSATQSVAAQLPANPLVSDRSVVQQLSAVSADLQAAASGGLVSGMSTASQQSAPPYAATESHYSTQTSSVQQSRVQQSPIQQSILPSASFEQSARISNEQFAIQQMPRSPIDSLEAQQLADTSLSTTAQDSSSNYRFSANVASSAAQQQSVETQSICPVLQDAPVVSDTPLLTVSDSVMPEQHQEASVNAQAETHHTTPISPVIPPIPNFSASAVNQANSQFSALILPAPRVMDSSRDINTAAVAVPISHRERDFEAPPQLVHTASTANVSSVRIPIASSPLTATEPAAIPNSGSHPVVPAIPLAPAVSKPLPLVQRDLSVTPAEQPPPAVPIAYNAAVTAAQQTSAPPIVLQPTSATMPVQSMQQTVMHPAPVAPAPVAVAPAPVYQLPPQLQAIPMPAAMQTLSAPSQPLYPRPVGAFSYTAPAAGLNVTSRDAYLPAVAYSPARTRVSRDVPVDAELGHIRKSSFAANALEQWSAAPSVAVQSSRSVGPEPQDASQGQQGISMQQIPVPAIPAMPVAPLLVDNVQNMSAVQSRGVEVNSPAMLVQSGDTTSLSSGMMQSAETTASSSPMLQPLQGGLIPGTVIGPGVTSTFIPPAPFAAQSGPTPISNGVPAGYTITPPGPVCEGHEGNSDTWSVADSVASDPEASVFAGQQESADAPEPAKQSRLGRLLSRNKSAEAVTTQRTAATDTGSTGAARGGIKAMFRRKTKESLPRATDLSAATSHPSAALADQESNFGVSEQTTPESAAFTASEHPTFADQATVLPDTLPQNVPQAPLSSKPLLASFTEPFPSSPTSSPDRAAMLHGNAGTDAYDPLSTAYEEHATHKATPARAREEEAPVLAADFDPLAATYEEYNLWQMAQLQQSDLGQGNNSAVQSPQASAPASPTAKTAARKTRSIPGFFKLRKAASATSEASDAAGTDSADLPADGVTVSEDLAAASMQVHASGSETGSMPGSPISGKQHKGHKRGLSTFIRRTRSNLSGHKETMPAETAQLPEPVQEEAPAEQDTGEASAQDESSAGLYATYPARAPLVYLPTTFDSFMAGSHGVSSLPQLSPRQEATATYQAESTSTSTNLGISQMMSATTAASQATFASPPDTALPAAPFPPSFSPDASSSTAPVAAEVLGSTDFADIQLELPVAAAAQVPVATEPSETAVQAVDESPAVPSAASSAPNSIWKMLSLRPAKPPRQASKVSETAVLDTQAQSASASAQASQSSLQLPSTAEALARSQHDMKTADNTAGDAGSAAEEEVNVSAPQQAGTGLSKRLSFLSSFRRTSTQAPAAMEVSQSVTAVPEEDVAPLQTAAMENRLVEANRRGSHSQALQQSQQSASSSGMQQRGLTAGAMVTGKDAVGSHIELPPVFDYADAEDALDLQAQSASGSQVGPIAYPVVSSPERDLQHLPYPTPVPAQQPAAADEHIELFFDEHSDVDRYEYTQEELGSMLEIMACMKGVAGLLQQAEVWLSAFLHQAMYAQMQQFVQLLLTQVSLRAQDKVLQPVRLLQPVVGSYTSPAPAVPTSTKSKTFSKAKSLLSFKGHAAPTSRSFSPSGRQSMQLATSAGAQPAAIARQVAPSELHILVLQYTAEQALRSETEGKQWVKSMLDLESPLSKELKQFLHSSHSWEALLNLSNSCSRASDFSGLWLHEIHLENIMPRYRQPLAHTLPWQLANHALVYPQEQLTEVALTPLEIYNDVQAHAACDLDAEHLVDKAQGDAEACLRKLIVQLATQAFVQYKTAAGNSLADTTLLRGLVRSQGGPQPCFGVPRQFEGLFMQHGLALMGHSVDMATAVAQKVQSLLYQNAQYLVSLCEANDLTALVAFQGQVAVLQRTHSMLAVHLDLDPWEVIWAGADGRQSINEPGSRLAQHVCQQLVQDLLPNFGYCEPTQRFARLVPPSHTPLQPDEPQPAFGFGPAGATTGPNGAWARAFEGWFGLEHLQAIFKLTGPGGIASMMHAVLQHLGQLVQEPLLEPLRYILHNYPKLLLQASYTRCAPGGAADLFAQIQYQVQQMLVLRNDWQAALPKLTELGNALALVTLLDAMLGAAGDAHLMQLAPLLGISLNAQGHMQRTASYEAGQTPLAAAVQAAQGNTPDTVAQALAQEAEEMAWQAVSNTSLMPCFLQTLHQALQPSLAELTATPVNFSSVWSVLLFALASTEPSFANAAVSGQHAGLHPAQQAAAAQRQHVRQPDLSSFGDGLLWGASLLLHSLRQAAHFKLTDLNTLLLESHQLGWRSAGANTDRQDFVGFVMRAHATKGMMSRVLAMLSAIEPQPLQAIGISRDTTDGTALQFAPDALLSTAPVQVLQPVQQMAEQTVQESVTQEAVVPKQVLLTAKPAVLHPQVTGEPPRGLSTKMPMTYAFPSNQSIQSQQMNTTLT